MQNRFLKSILIMQLFFKTCNHHLWQHLRFLNDFFLSPCPLCTAAVPQNVCRNQRPQLGPTDTDPRLGLGERRLVVACG